MSAKSIYIHLPFCKTKCPYCDFASFADHNKDRQEEYIEALVTEINFRMAGYKPESNNIQTIFFGGGTPSVHSAEQLQRILNTLKKYFSFAHDIEVTLEANPGTIDKSKLAEFKSIGINRISIGAQTFDPDLLIKLGRGHSIDDTLQVIANIQAVNFNSWSLDLIYGLPGQTLESWSKTLVQALSFDPPHISAYALSIEEKTPYGEIYKNSYHPDLPVEDSIVEMYQLTNDLLGKQGINRYEISNWSKPGHEAKHNLTYWYADEYYAFGLSAHGYIDSTRYKNTRDLPKYIEAFAEKNLESNFGYNFALAEPILIPESEKLEEKVLLGLRLTEGLEITEAISKFINKKNLSKNIDAGFLFFDNDRLKLTDRALMVSNTIISDLLV